MTSTQRIRARQHAVQAEVGVTPIIDALLTAPLVRLRWWTTLRAAPIHSVQPEPWARVFARGLVRHAWLVRIEVEHDDGRTWSWTRNEGWRKSLTQEAA